MRKALKKVMSIALTAAMSVSMLTVGAVTAQADDLKVGVILVGDETEGYTKAHMDGISQAAEELGMDESQIVWKYKVAEDSACYDSAVDLVGQGCNLVISNSYGHQTFMVMAAQEYPDTTFVSMTGDFAAISGCSNFKNAFTKVYESRYVSGVVAGMKLAELLESGTLTADVQPDSFDADGNVKIGYVGAYNYAEVVSGYTAFYLGLKSVVPNVVMEVLYTNSWFDIDKEAAAAEQLIAKGCVIIGQHADSTGAPASTQKLITGITALDELGVDYQYITSLNYTGRIDTATVFCPDDSTYQLRRGSLQGNLYITGVMDPKLNSDDLDLLACNIYKMGIDTITGNICGDATFMKDNKYGQGWCWDDDNPELSSLLFGRKDGLLQNFAKALRKAGIVILGNVFEWSCPESAQWLTSCTHSLPEILEKVMEFTE